MTDATLTKDPSFHELRKAVSDAAAAKVAAENALYHARQQLEIAAEPVCSTCLNLTHSVEFNYTYCKSIGDVSGRFDALDRVAMLMGGKFVCSRYRAGGTLKGKP